MRPAYEEDTRFCALLKKHLARLGGVAAKETEALYREAMAISRLDDRAEHLALAQFQLVQTLAEMTPRVRDDKLRSDLADALIARQLSTQSMGKIPRS